MKFVILFAEDLREKAGFAYNEGPPHDRNWNWVDGKYAEQLHPSVLRDSYAEIRLLVDEAGIPLEFQGKWVLDSYLLLPKESQVK